MMKTVPRLDENLARNKSEIALGVTYEMRTIVHTTSLCSFSEKVFVFSRRMIADSKHDSKQKNEIVEEKAS